MLTTRPSKPLRLQRLREAQHITRTVLGARASLHPSVVGQIEGGRYIPPNDSVTLSRLAAALGWQGDPAELLDVVDDGRPGELS